MSVGGEPSASLPGAERRPRAPGGTDVKREPELSRWRVGLGVIWPPTLVLSAYVAVGRLGFYPSDEGLLQAYSYRILLGEVPHRDFVSPRPLGSALLHLLDFAIPGPLFEVSRVIAMVEFVAYAIVFAWLIYGLAPWRWGPVAAMVAAGSALMNLNTFPLIAWYTVDGLVFIGIGYLLIVRGTSRRSFATVAAGFVVLGLAALTKQSFAPAAAFGWVLLFPWLKELRWAARLRHLVLTGLTAALPSVAFVVVISAMGGFLALRTQLLSGAIVYGRPLLASWSPRNDLLGQAALVGAAAALAVGIELARRPGRGLTRLAETLCRIGLSGLIFGVPLVSRLGLHGPEWGIRVMWMMAAIVVVRSALDRSPDVAGFAILGAAWMSSLSYGFPWPNLVGGSMAVYVLHRAWVGGELPGMRRAALRPAPAVAAALILSLTAYVFVLTREQDVYEDRPASQLTASLHDFSPALGDIRTNPETAAYLAAMAACIRQYPARWVAVLPENAAVYPALQLRNPFPIDWMWPADMRGSEARILATAAELNREGDYLVMFQTVGYKDLVSGRALPPATLSSAIYAYSATPGEIYAQLNGQRTTCGPFLVVYSPPGG